MSLPIIPVSQFVTVRTGVALRLNGTDEKLTRTNTLTGTRNKQTFSAWVKLAATGLRHPIFTSDNGTGGAQWYIDTSNRLHFAEDVPADAGAQIDAQGGTSISSGVWTHVFAVYDSSQGTAANRLKFWINGVQDSISFGATPDLNQNTSFAIPVLHSVGRHDNSGAFFQGDLAYVWFLDTVAGTVTDYADTIDGTYQAKLPTPTMGSNAFYLDFVNSADLGNDAGSTHDYTLSNIDSTNQVGDGPPVNF